MSPAGRDELTDEGGEGFGGVDLPGGSMAKMNASLRTVILPMADEVIVCPGHGPQTTIGRERLTNPFLRNLT